MFDHSQKNIKNSMVDYLYSNNGTLQISIEVPRIKYLDKFFKMKSSIDMLEYKLFPNAKEFTESYGCFNAVLKHVRYDFQNPDVDVLVIGDGSTPRTGALFAFMSNWNVISVDPSMRIKKSWKNINRLETKVGFFGSEPDQIKYNNPDKDVIVVLPHSHCSMDNVVKNVVGNTVTIVSIPCCISSDLNGIEPDVEYTDWNIWSDKRYVKIWKNVDNTYCL